MGKIGWQAYTRTVHYLYKLSVNLELVQNSLFKKKQKNRKNVIKIIFKGTKLLIVKIKMYIVLCSLNKMIICSIILY